jgi:phage terminase large subunit-like protein
MDDFEYLVRALKELERREEGERFYRMYPAEGPLARDKYPKHWEFFNLGKTKPFRLFLGGNGVGKTEGIGCYEVTCHLTGQYPEGWDGIRYDKPIYAVVAGKTNENVRDIIQPKLIGRLGKYGTGMVPRDCLPEDKITRRSGSSGAIDNFAVKHVSGGYSICQFKSYEMGPEAFMGFEADVQWYDEEPPPEIYSEGVQRFRTRRPCMIITFTPLDGISDVVAMFLPQFADNYSEEEYAQSGRAYVMCGQDEVPHLSDEEKRQLIANSLSFQREARRLGMPSIGAGKIYQVEEGSFVISPLQGGLPRHWPRIYGFDVGLNTTAALWMAHDLDTDVVYGYSEHYEHQKLPAVHAQAIKARGHWIPGEIDPSSRNRNPKDGEKLFDTYRNLGLRLKKADNAVSSGIYTCQERLETGRFKLYSTCTNFISEYRNYRRDKNGKIVKVRDHLMDGWRYGMTGLSHAMVYHGDMNKRVPTMQEQTFGVYQ